MRLTDAHCHLHDPRLAADLDGVLDRARRAGVDRMVCCGTAESDWEAVSALAARAPGLVVPAYGLHPWEAARRSPDWQRDLERRLSSQSRAVAGEFGLDHALEPRDDADQEAVFLAQWRLSAGLRLPACLHGRRAWGRLLELISREGPHPTGFILHAYSGGAELVPAFAALGAFFSFGGGLTWSNNRRAHRAAAAAPEARLLVETDAPDLAPAGWGAPGAPPPPNEPATLPRVVVALAALRGWTEEKTAARTSANADALFGRREGAP